MQKRKYLKRLRWFGWSFGRHRSKQMVKAKVLLDCAYRYFFLLLFFWHVIIYSTSFLFPVHRFFFRLSFVLSFFALLVFDSNLTDRFVCARKNVRIMHVTITIRLFGLCLMNRAITYCVLLSIARTQIVLV